MGKRYIRLKEMTPGTDRVYTPTEAQLETTDGSPAGEDYRCRVDGDGFILTGNPDLDGAPLVFMGDSFVESMFAHEETRFVSQVERLIGLKCLNAGYSGSTTLQILNSFINKVYAAVGPNATIILCPPHSDRDNIYKPGRYWNNSDRGATILPVGRPGHEGIPEGVVAFQQMLSIFVAAARELGWQLILVTTPFRKADFSHDAPLRRLYRRDRALYELGLKRRIEFCDAIRTMADKTGTPLIDLEEALKGRPEYFYDELHLTSLGHNVTAQILATHLRGVEGTCGVPVQSRVKDVQSVLHLS